MIDGNDRATLKEINEVGKKRSTETWTPARQFRLSEETLTEMDYIMERYQLSSRAEVIRHLVHRTYLAEKRNEKKEDEAK